MCRCRRGFLMKTKLEEWVQASKNVIPHLFLNGPEEFVERPCLGTKRNGAYSYITYKQLKDKICHFAAFLRNNDFRSQDKLIILAENREEWIVSDLGTMLVGGVIVPIYPTLSPHQMEYIVRHSDARVAVVSSQIQYNKLAKMYETFKIP